MKGPFLLAFDSGTAYAVSLISQSLFTLRRFESPEYHLAANSSDESTEFRNLAANSLFCSLIGGVDSDFSLHTLPFDLSTSAALTEMLTGNAFVGPVVHHHAVAIADLRSIQILDSLDNRTLTFELPNGFHPYTRRPSRPIHVPVGHIPFAIHQTKSGWQAWLAGELEGSPGLLQARIDSEHYDFHQVLPGSCISQLSSECLAFTTDSGLQFTSQVKASGRITGTMPTMPVLADGNSFVFFRHGNDVSAHNVTVMFDSAQPISVAFQDDQCEKHSCCGYYRFEDDILLCYFSHSSVGAPGLRFAHWTLQ